MAEDRQKGKKQPELRIVDEFDDSEEVTRLDGPSSNAPNPPRKKANLRRSHEQFAMVQDLKDSNAPSVKLQEPAVDEVGAAQPVAPLRIPPIFFVLVAMLFLGLLAIGLFLAMGGRHRDDVHRLQDQSRKNLALAKEEEKSARKMVAILSEALDKYSAAKTVEEKLAFSRQPERVGPLMKSYYATKEMSPLLGAKLVSQYALPIESRSFVVLTAAFDDAPDKIYLAEVDNDLSVRIDWESDVCYQPIEPAKYISERPTEPVDLRVFAFPDNFYVYEFADSEKYKCLKLTFRDSDDILYGYVERGSATSKRMAKHFELAARARIMKPEPLLLKVRFLENGMSERGVLIEQFLAPRWANIDEFKDED